MSSATLERIVQPSGSRSEGLVLFAITICVAGMLAWYVAVSGRDDSPPELLEWQISAFRTLEGADQAVYNSLFTVKDEIPYIYDDINLFNEPGEKFRWPNFDDFQEWLLPPFYKDTSWEQNGSLEWTLFEPLAEGEMQGSIMYLGTNGSLAGQGSFLLIIGHVHAGITNNNAMQIWYNSQRSVSMPERSYQDSIIREGWQLVIPYQGNQEVERLFGE
jgi:hypothetical protein